MQPLTAAAITYFDLLGVPPGVRVDPRAMERAFWSLQKQLHPDLHARKTREEQDIASANAALVNQAYQTLRDPVRRVQYLLQLLKGQDDAQAAADAERPSTPPDPQLLMFVYQTREDLEDCSSEEEARAVEASAEAAVAAALQTLAEAADAGDVAALETGLAKLQYLAKIEAEARTAAHRLHDAARARRFAGDEYNTPVCPR